MFYTATVLTLLIYSVKCIENKDFNASLRDYAKADETNSSHIQTLQKFDPESFKRFVPTTYPIHYKAQADSAVAGSSHSRGLHHEYPAYAHDFEENPIEYHHPPEYEHYPQGYGHGYVGHHGYHYKHYDHGIKAFLLPVAGLAILGAAAALVSNPILLQLGVISGRKRRDTSESNDNDFAYDSLSKWTPNLGYETSTQQGRKKRMPSDLQSKVNKNDKEKGVLNKNLLLKPFPYLKEDKTDIPKSKPHKEVLKYDNS